MDIQAVLSRNS